MFYFVRTPWLIKKIFSTLLWQVETKEKQLYLTFDDGPHPIHTPKVLDILQQYNAKATFFCIGNNVRQNPNVYKRIILEGHSIGNHTYNHLNGKKNKDDVYINDVADAATYIDSKLFRPPYGSITNFQAKILQQKNYKIIMWSLLSGDFDVTVTKEKCLENVLLKTKEGSIIVFHDSDKAAVKMLYALPRVIKTFVDLGYTFEKL